MTPAPRTDAPRHAGAGTTRRHGRPRLVAVAALAVVALCTAGCIPNRVAGRRCSTTDWGEGGGWVMQCQRGRWIRVAPTADVAGALAARKIGQRTFSGPTIRIAIGGDSTGGRIAQALARFQAAHPGDIEVLDLTMDNCTITFAAQMRHYDGERGQDMRGCGLWSINVPRRVGAFHPTVSLVFLAMMEQADQRAQPTDPWTNVLNPVWRAHQLDAFRQYTTDLASTGAKVLWADVPVMRFLFPKLPWISDDPARTAALNGAIAQLDAERADVERLDYASHLDRPGGAIDTSVRPDGIHLTDAAADFMVSKWLIPLLVARR
jgi:hypothetical protein